MRRPLPVEQLAAPLVLRVVGVFDLEPSDPRVHSGRDAPKLAVRATGIEPVGLTGSLSFAARETSAARDPNRRACIAERAGAYRPHRHEGDVGDRGSWEVYNEAEQELAACMALEPISEEADRDNWS